MDENDTKNLSLFNFGVSKIQDMAYYNKMALYYIAQNDIIKWYGYARALKESFIAKISEQDSKHIEKIEDKINKIFSKMKEEKTSKEQKYNRMLLSHCNKFVKYYWKCVSKLIDELGYADQLKTDSTTLFGED